MPKPTHYVSRLEAIALETYKCHVNGNREYVNVMLDPLTKLYDLRGGSRVEKSKVNRILRPVASIPLFTVAHQRS